MIYSASLKEHQQDKLDGFHPIHTREELDKVVVNTGVYNKVIIRADFAEKNFTPSGIIDYINNSKLINPNIIFELDKEAENYTPNKFIEKMMSVRNLQELIGLAVKNEEQFLKTYKELVSGNNDTNMQLIKASSKISKQQEIHDAQAATIESLKDEVKVVRNNYIDLQNTLQALLGRINNQYNKGVDKTRLFYTDRHSYDKVLYIKELSRVQYTDSLIYYLKEILKVMYNIPVRSLVIESYYATGKVSLYPNHVPHYNLREKDVISGDILMLGNQPKLMKDVLKNSSNISFLIVLDRAGHELPHIIGEDVEYFYTLSDLKDKPDKLPNSRVIGYTHDTLNIPMMPKFEEMDPGQRISKYSSLEIVKKILSTLGI